MRTRPARLANVAGFNIDVVAEAAGNDPDVLRLENLDTDLAPPPEAIAATRAAVGELAANSFLPFIGRLDLREAVAARVGRRSGVAFDPETEVVITASEGDGVLDALLALVDHGDEVILTDPCYAGLVNRVRLAGAVPRLVPLRTDGGRWRLDLDALAAAVTDRTRAILLLNPSFPSGCVLTDEEWSEVARHCVERDLWLLYWALMEGIVFDGAQVRHPLHFDGMRERTVTIGTVTCEQRMIGWRIGWMVAPEAVMPDLAIVHMYNGVVAGGIGQAGAFAALTAPDDGLTASVAEWQDRRDTIGAELRGFPMTPAAGGWSQLLDAHGLGVDAGDLSRALLTHKVAATPMTGWGGEIADRHVRLVFSREPAQRLRLLGERMHGALDDLGVPATWRRG